VKLHQSVPAKSRLRPAFCIYIKYGKEIFMEAIKDFTHLKFYDKTRLAQLKEDCYMALGKEIPSHDNQERLPASSLAAKRQAAEDALIDFADELLSDDSKAQTLLRQRRLDMKKQLVELILRLSTE